jgi:hypothetical protein
MSFAMIMAYLWTPAMKRQQLPARPRGASGRPHMVKTKKNTDRHIKK